MEQRSVVPACPAGEARVSQRLFLCAELFEDLPDLPVGKMNDSHVVIPSRPTLTPLSRINQRFRRRCGYRVVPGDAV
jgi:hypothetical protein